MVLFMFDLVTSEGIAGCVFDLALKLLIVLCHFLKYSLFKAKVEAYWHEVVCVNADSMLLGPLTSAALWIPNVRVSPKNVLNRDAKLHLEQAA